MPSGFSTVGNPRSLQDLLSSSLKPFKTLISNPISDAGQKIITTQEAIKEKLKFFKSSTKDFPNLAGKLNNKAREYLEADRFYKLEPTDSDLKEKTIQQIHNSSNTIKDKYPLDLQANQNYVYPISLLQSPVITRPFFRESERAHDINLRKEIRSEVKNDRQEFISRKQAARDYIEREFPELLIDTVYVDKLLKDSAPDSDLVKLWENAPQESNMGRFRTATNRQLQPLYEKQRDFRLKPELRELIDKYFPFERLKLKPEFLPREHGLKHSLRLYLNNLKNYEPHLYNFCLNATQNINKQNPLPEDTKAFINIAVHQSETNLPHLLKILQKQDFNKSECPVYLFVNGNDKKQIQERLAEINTFIQDLKTNNPDNNLNVRVIAAELDHYRHGLKTIPLNLAYMDLALNHDFKKSDADIAAIYLDADILKFPSDDHLSKLKNGILAGKIRNHAAFKWDFDKLTKLNIHYPIMHALSNEFASLEPIFNNLKERFNRNNYKTWTDTGILNCGGHTSYSSILTLLTGATKAHVNNEDPDWSERASKVLFSSHLRSFYDREHIYQAMTNNLPAVEVDEGALERPMKLNRPMKDIWVSHDLIHSNDDKLSPINFDKPEELNNERVKQEITILTKDICKKSVEFGREAFNEKRPSDLTEDIIITVLNHSLRSLSKSISESPLNGQDKTKVLKLINNEYKKFFGCDMNKQD
jgi:hypothetical protein